MYYVYMLKSKGVKPVTYVGYTNNLEKRIFLHNSSKGAKFTKGRKWKLIFKDSFKTKKEDISREYYIKKNRKLRNKIKMKIAIYYPLKILTQKQSWLSINLGKRLIKKSKYKKKYLFMVILKN